MNAKTPTPDHKSIAQEATFQVDCDRELADWMYALMTAIQDDQKRAGGNSGLARLGTYLAETHLADAEKSLEVLNTNMQSLGGVQ